MQREGDWASAHRLGDSNRCYHRSWCGDCRWNHRCYDRSRGHHRGADSLRSSSKDMHEHITLLALKRGALATDANKNHKTMQKCHAREFTLTGWVAAGTPGTAGRPAGAGVPEPWQQHRRMLSGQCVEGKHVLSEHLCIKPCPPRHC